MDFIVNNYKWLFSGILTALMIFLLGIIINRRNGAAKKNINQKISGKSKGIQSGRDTNISG